MKTRQVTREDEEEEKDEEEKGVVGSSERVEAREDKEGLATILKPDLSIESVSWYPELTDFFFSL